MTIFKGHLLKWNTATKLFPGFSKCYFSSKCLKQCVWIKGALPYLDRPIYSLFPPRSACRVIYTYEYMWVYLSIYVHTHAY